MKEEHNYLFEKMPVLQAMLHLALPTVASQIILVIYNMADTFFIGLVGSDAMLSAVTVCMPAFMFLSAIANLFGVGGGSTISRSLGKKNKKRAVLASSFAFCFCLIVTLLYVVSVYYFRDTFIDLLGGSDYRVHDLAITYLTVTVVIGGLTTALSMLISHLLRAEGLSFAASFGIALGGILNCFLDTLFMFVILPAGNEVLGAAIATALANLLSCLYLLAYSFYKKKEVVLSLFFHWDCLKDGIPQEILITGLPACIMTLCENISYAILDKLMSLWSMSYQAYLGVAKKVNMLAHSIVRGITQGSLPLIAYNYASNDHKRMNKCVRCGVYMSATAAMLCMCCSLLFGKTIISLFISSSSQGVEMGTRFLKILCVGAPFSAVAYSFISFFQAAGKGGRSFILALLRKGLLDIPLMFILNIFIPVYGVVYATPLTDIICCFVSITMFVLFRKKYLLV